MLTITIAEDSRDRANVFALRGAVFVAEQGVPIDSEWDSHDLDADHFLARRDGAAVGAGRLVVDRDEGVLGRLAVLGHARGTGVGAELVCAIEERARARGLRAVELHAQTRALGFYERLGYVPYGPEFDEAGIAHRHMRKELV